jgi:hypothetical protein
VKVVKKSNRRVEHLTKTMKLAKYIGLAAIAVLPSAFATPTIIVDDNAGHTLTIVDGDANDTSGLAGSVSYSGGFGSWIVTVSTGVTKPLTGTATSPEMDLAYSATGTGSGTLTIKFSENGFGPSSGAANITFGGTQPSGWSSSGQVLGSSVNTEFAGSGIGSTLSYGTTSFSGDTTGALPSASPYALTEIVNVSYSGSGVHTASGDINLSTPDGGMTLMLLGSAFGGIEFIRRKFAK